MAHRMEGNRRIYEPCSHPECYIHSAKGVEAVNFSPNNRKHWDRVWSVVKAQPWYEADVSIVKVGVDGFAYCQYPQQTTGLARAFVGTRT